MEGPPLIRCHAQRGIEVGGIHAFWDSKCIASHISISATPIQGESLCGCVGDITFDNYEPLSVNGTTQQHMQEQGMKANSPPLQLFGYEDQTANGHIPRCKGQHLNYNRGSEGI